MGVVGGDAAIFVGCETLVMDRWMDGWMGTRWNFLGQVTDRER